MAINPNLISVSYNCIWCNKETSLSVPSGTPINAKSLQVCSECGDILKSIIMREKQIRERL